MTVTLHLLDTGYCLASEHHVMRGGEKRTFECHALVGLIHHPAHGWGLWDTGYALRMLDATERWPYRVYRHATPLHISDELAVVRQLGRWGLSVDDIRWIVLSHLHADHAAGLLDFPNAEIILSAAALEFAHELQGVRALLSGVISSLLPADLVARARPIASFDGPVLHGLGPTCDLFGDGSILLVDLPGHARGQIGALLRTPEREVLLSADAAWTSAAIRRQLPPSPITYGFIDDVAALKRSLAGLGAFASARPDVTIIPTHCPEVFASEVRGE